MVPGEGDAVIDRVGEVWEFDDGMITLVVTSRARKGQAHEVGPTEHDVIVLRGCLDLTDDTPEGSFSEGWHESEGLTWDDRVRSGRWRIA